MFSEALKIPVFGAVLAVSFVCACGPEEADPDPMGLPSSSSGGTAGDGDDDQGLGGLGGEESTANGGSGSVQCEGEDCPEPSGVCHGVVCPGASQGCVEQGGVAVCQCYPGYVPGSGTDCVDDNECSGSEVCGSGATCVNFPGGYRCECSSGFSKDSSGTCKDRNECQTGSACDPDFGLCSDLEGGYACACAVGKVGDGYFCKGAAACSVETCKSGGSCIETATGALCLCPLGTTGPDCSEVSACAPSVVLNGAENPRITDPHLLSALHMLTGVPLEANLTVQDLAPYSSLTVNFGEVESLSGLECWSTLEELYLFNHNVSDLSPLANLSGLRVLDLTCNPVTDLSPLSGLQLLESLSLVQSPVCTHPAQLGSAAPLETLRGLSELSLVGQGLTSAEPLSALRRLETLDLTGNELTSLAPLSQLSDLEELGLGHNQISDLSSLQAGDFPALRRLSLASNGISSLGHLGLQSALERLDLTDNEITNPGVLSELSGLHSLYLGGNLIFDVEALAQLTGLSLLRLENNQVSSVAPFLENEAFGHGGQVWLTNNPLDCEEEASYLVELESRGLSFPGLCED